MHKALLITAVSLMSGIVPSFAVEKNASATVAESVTEQDRADLKVVKSFMAAWPQTGHGSDYLADNAVVIVEPTKPPLAGRQAYIDRWAALEPGQTMSVKFHGFYARTPVVVAVHTDILKTPGKPDQIFKEEVGVFIVKDGKVVNFVDYHRPHG